MKISRLLHFLLLLLPLFTIAQVKVVNDTTSVKIDYDDPHNYQLEAVKFSGADHFDQRVLILLTGLAPGDKIQVPGDKVTKASYSTLL